MKKVLNYLRRKWRKLFFILRGIYQYNFFPKNKILKPRKVTVVLTYQCNSRCIMCNIWKKQVKNELTVKEWSTVLDDPVFSEIEEITFTGGEAILCLEFLVICKLFINKLPHLYKINLVSNGLASQHLLDQVRGLLKLIVKHNLELSVSVSLDGLAKTHDDIRGIKGAFNKVKATLLALKKLQKKQFFYLGSGSVLMHTNIDQIDELQNWLKKQSIHSHVQIVGFHDSYVANLKNKIKVDFSDKDKSKIYIWLQKLAKPQSWKDLRSYYWQDLYQMYKFKKGRTTPCPFLHDAFAIDSLGDVYYCLSEKSIGNCRSSKTVSQLYYDRKNLEFRKNLPKRQCLTCNSGCDVSEALAKDFKRYIYFRLTGKTWPKM